MQFIVLEGCDGAGKSTIRNVLMELFEQEGYNCLVIGQHSWLDPWNSRVISNVRNNYGTFPSAEIAEAYFTDKVLHSNININTATDSIIIADRYIYSDAVYQKVLYGTEPDQTINRFIASEGVLPNLIIYVVLDGNVAYTRIQKRSKQIMHYEKPTNLVAINVEYDKIFNRSDNRSCPPVLVFHNDKANYRELILTQLFPSVLDRIKSTNRDI